MIFDDKDIATLLDALRDGDVYRSSSSGGRYATTCSYRDGAFVVERFDEGTLDEYRWNDDEMRAFIRRCGDDDVWLRMLVEYRHRKR